MTSPLRPLGDPSPACVSPAERHGEDGGSSPVLATLFTDASHLLRAHRLGAHRSSTEGTQNKPALWGQQVGLLTAKMQNRQNGGSKGEGGQGPGLQLPFPWTPSLAIKGSLKKLNRKFQK